MNPRFLITLSLLAAFVVPDLSAQTLAQRQSLATTLTSVIGTTVSIPIGTGTYGTISLRKMDGSCGEPVESIIDISPGSTGTFRFRMRLRPSAGTMDLVWEDHPLICDLNTWIGFNIHTRSDFWLRDTGNVNLHFNTACNGTSSPPKFFSLDLSHSGCGLGFGGNDQWRINPWGLYRQYYGMVRTGGTDYYSGNFWSSHLCIGGRLPADPDHPFTLAYSQGSYPIFIGRRNQDWKDWLGVTHHDGIELYRAHSVLQFDYRYNNYDGSAIWPDPKFRPQSASDDPGNYPSYSDTSYVLPWLADPNKKRLDSIVYIARMQSYGTDCSSCTPNPSFAPQADSASRTIQVYYTQRVGMSDSCSGMVSFTASYKDAAGPDTNNTHLWNDHDIGGLEGAMRFEMDTEGNVFLKFKTNTPITSTCLPSPSGEQKFYIVKVRKNEIPDEYCDIILPNGGTFGLDNKGSIVYVHGDDSTKIHCLNFCEPITSDSTIENVIAAAAQSFSDQWQYDPDAVGSWESGEHSPYGLQVSNKFQKGSAGKWRPKGSWKYRSDVKSAASMASERVYDNAGVFVDGLGSAVNAFRLFNWVNEPTSPTVGAPNWLNATTVTRYAPSGEPIEERNILGIYGAAKLAHNNTVPLLVAQNAQYDAVDFESFEEYPVDAESRATFDYAHAGRTSYKLEPTFSPALLTLRITDQMAPTLPPPPLPPPQPVDDMRGLLIKFWVKRTYQLEPPIPLPVPLPPILPIQVEIKGVDAGGSPVDVLDHGSLFNLWVSGPDSASETRRFYKVAQTGEWSLYQLIVDDFKVGMVGTKVTVKVAKNPGLGPDDVWIDDIRAQPITAQMGCYVYDRDNLRLLAQFDDQHFGLFYQYNGEGKLVRKLRETERGVKTVAETQYHTPFADRDFSDEALGNDLNPDDVYSSIRSGGTDGMHGRGAGADFDLFRLRAGQDGVKTMILGDSAFNARRMKERLLSKVDLSQLDRKALGAFAAEVPEMERIGLLKELVELEKQKGALEEEAGAETSEIAREELQARLERIEERRNEILRDRLGLTDEEIRTLYDEMEKEGGKPESESGDETNDPE